MRDRSRFTPKNYGGSYTPPESLTDAEELSRCKFFLKDKIKDMLKYGMPLVDNFPRKSRQLAGCIRAEMLNMLRLAVTLEKVYYKKTTIRDLDTSLAVLRELILLASDRDYYGPKYAPPLSMHQREVWSRFNAEIGNMVGKYIQSVQDFTKEKDGE